MSKTLFEYAIVLQEKKDKDGNVTEEAQILVAPTHVLAKSASDVNIIASRAIPEEQVINLERITLAVRPF